MLLYPRTLPTLLKIWRDLEDHGRVSFQQRCDYFYHTLSNRPHPGSAESSRLYTAAFLSLWICCFVVMGGGPYIRPGVLVMASWMALGRRFALTQPALCSLVLFKIDLDNLRRIGPIDYLIGWMGVYMPTTFHGRVCRYLSAPTLQCSQLC
jgi:peptide alpha-N-acetyltransferase